MTSHNGVFAYSSSLAKTTQETLSRSHETLSTPAPAPHTPARRLADVAQSLSRRGLDAAAVELFNAALQRTVELAWQADSDGGWCNTDPVTGRLLFALPFGSNGHAKWSLRTREATCLSRILLARMTPAPGAYSPLFLYAPESRTWHLAMADYPSYDAALAYMKAAPVTVKEYRDTMRQLQDADARRRQRR